MPGQNCSRCSARLVSDAPDGLCPDCRRANESHDSVDPSAREQKPRPQPPPPHEIQKHFPQLEILRLIGRGGMGAVYEARQRGLNRRVALKLLWPPPIPQAGFEQRFAREGRALASLSQDNIVTVHDAGISGPYYWIVMEYVDGVNLRQVIQRELIEPSRALSIVVQMCAALEYAHQKGVIHRDIKPENILISSDGRIKIADFGLAKILARDPEDPTLTGSLHAMGTLHYMAPEQFERPKEVDHRADIYSLGVVLYEVLTGELPIGRFLMPSRRAKLDERLDDIVAKALQKEPKRRYQTASEVSTAVGIVAAPRPPARTPARASAVRVRPTKRRSYGMVIAGLAALLVFVLVVGRMNGFEVGASGSDMSARQAFDLGRARIQKAETFMDGLRLLELAYTKDSTIEGLRAELARALPAGIQQKIRSSEPLEAAKMASRLHELDPSTASSTLLEDTRRAMESELGRMVRVDSPALGAVFDTNEVVLQGSISRDAGDVGLTLDGQLIQPLRSQFTHALTGLVEGVNTMELMVSLDGAAPLPFTRSFIVDTQAPVLRVSFPADNSYVPRSFEISGTCEDSSKTTVRFGEETVIVSGNQPWKFAVTRGDGRHSLEVSATDEAQHVKSWTIPVVVDTKPPVIDLLGQATDFVSATRSGTFKVKGTDDQKLKALIWDGQEVPAKSGETVLIPTDFGRDESTPIPHQLEAIDMAGNRSKPIVITTRFDATPPKITYAAKALVVSGKTHMLTVEFEDRSECVLAYDGTTYFPSRTGRFEIPIAVPSGWVVDQTLPIAFQVLDAARNQAPKGRVVLTMGQACESCGGDKQCKSCGGSATGPCRVGCENGIRIAKCPTCQGLGKELCSECNGQGKQFKVPCPSGCDTGYVTCSICAGTAKKKVKCSAYGCKDGWITQTAPVHQRFKCKSCDNQGIATATCPSTERCPSNCRGGFLNQPCTQCTDGKSDSDCLDCKGKKRRAEPCGVCQGGQVIQPCANCGPEGLCKSCHGSGLANALGDD